MRVAIAVTAPHAASTAVVAGAKIATAAMLASERPMGRMTRLGSRWSYQLPYATLDHEIEQIGAVTLADIHAYLDAHPLDDLLAVRGGG